MIATCLPPRSRRFSSSISPLRLSRPLPIIPHSPINRIPIHRPPPTAPPPPPLTSMVKLASARESRTYGPRPSGNRWEYINAGIYLLAGILVSGGYASLLSPTLLHEKSGLAVVLIGLALVVSVNVHDLVAHLAGIDFCLELVRYDLQLALVEFAVPTVNIVGSILAFIGVLFFSIQIESGYSYRLEKHALNTLIAGPVFWVLGSIHSVCQIYERADGHVQILQKSVQVPFLMGSLLFLAGGIINRLDIFGAIHSTFMIWGKTWIWLCLCGGLLFLAGGLLNVVKVFKMQQRDDGLRLERLRGGAHECLARMREGQVPLILESSNRSLESSNRRRKQTEEARPLLVPTPVPVPLQPAPGATPYKDVLLGNAPSTIA